MRDTEHFKNHMTLVTQVDGETIGDQPIEDPFITTKIGIRLTRWEAVKLLWTRAIDVRVKVRADGCAIGRWFQGADICEKCCRNRIEGHSTKPGYESHGMRVCEDCYYEKPIRLETLGESVAVDIGMTGPV